MPTPDDTANQLQTEWRAIILAKLNSLEAGQQAISKDIADMRMQYARQSDVDGLREDVNKLKLWKASVIGICIAVNAVAVIIGWMIQTYISAGHH